MAGLTEKPSGNSSDFYGCKMLSESDDTHQHTTDPILVPTDPIIEKPSTRYPELISSGLYDYYERSDKIRDVAHLIAVDLDLGAEPRPKVDGDAYVKAAFGGFGPGSPEYDGNRRLTIRIPHPREAVAWFQDTDQAEHYLTNKYFSNAFNAAHHPGVAQVGVAFWKDHKGTQLISGQVDMHTYALDVPNVPSTDVGDSKIDTYYPGQKLFKSHIGSRLEQLYPGKIEHDKDNNVFNITVNPEVAITINATNFHCIRFAINGHVTIASITRYNETQKSTKAQLEKELLALQEHFPLFAEICADFFRKQLPKAEILVNYKSPTATRTATKDPVNPERMALLRQDLLAEPRDDDFRYIGGLAGDIAQLRRAAVGFARPEAFREYGVSPPRGILLYGPPGTGKTSLAMGFAREIDAKVLHVKASTIKNAFHGETERNIRGVFQLADELIAEGEKVVIFIDEIESIAPARDSFGSTNIDRNVTTELLQGMNVDRENCIIIAATNVPGMVDSAITGNSSRFGVQLEIGLPDRAARRDIIEKLLQKFKDRSSTKDPESLFAGIDIQGFADDAEDATGADIENAISQVLVGKAVVFAETGVRQPLSTGELRQMIKTIIASKDKANGNYL